MTDATPTPAPPGRIVVGVDASDGAREALRWGLDEGRLRDVPVETLAVWSYLGQYDLTAQGFLPQFDEDLAAAALHEIVAGEMSDGDGLDVRERVLCDLPAKGLLGASVDASLLVVGARGLGLVKGALLGSVSDQCVRHASCPVAVVRGGHPRATRNEVVVGIDDSDHSQAALQWAIEEAGLRKATLRVVRAWQYPAVAGIGWEYAALTIDDLAAGAQHSLERTVAATTKAVVGSAPEIERVVQEGHAGKTLVDLAERAALLVVGARGHGGFAELLLGSTSSYCVHHAHGPVVVVH